MCAGVPTTWEVLRQLVAGCAGAAGETDDAVERAEQDPEGWWTERTGQPLRWGDLLEQLAPTPAARQLLLRKYFEPTEDPASSAAHHTLAALVKSGRINLIVTTNFDRLIERHLADVGVEPQVIATEDDVHGMTPLVHAPPTIVKLHGDYRSAVALNTDAELSSLPPAMCGLMDRILDEYGVLTVGWSATWDHALRQRFANRVSRRYPIWWTAHRGDLSEEAQTLVTNQEAGVISIADGSSFFTELRDSVERLDERRRRSSAPRFTSELAIAPDRWPEPTNKQTAHLHLMVAAQLAIPGDAETLRITPDVRDELVEVLYQHDLSTAIAVLAAGFPYGDTRLSSKRQIPGGWWEPTSGSHQSLTSALYTYVLPSSAVEASVSVVGSRLSAGPTVIASVSIRDGLPWDAVDAMIALAHLSDLTAAAAPTAIEATLDVDITATSLTIGLGTHLRDPQLKTDKLSKVLTVHRLEDSSRKEPSQLALSVILNSDPTALDFRSLMVDAFEHALLDHGWLDPREATADLRARIDRDRSGA